MASSSFNSRIGSFPAKFAWPPLLSFPFGGKDEETGFSAERRGPAQASVARDATINIPEPAISAHRFMAQSSDPHPFTYAQSTSYSTLNEPKSSAPHPIA